jgi:hypothetical protein
MGMKRRLLNVLTAFLLLLCLAVAALWVRSYFGLHAVPVWRDGDWQMMAFRGQFWFDHRPDRALIRQLTNEYDVLAARREALGRERHRLGPDKPTWYSMLREIHPLEQRMDTISRKLKTLQGQPRRRTPPLLHAYPFAVFAAAASAWPLARRVARRRTARLLTRGICPSCGYDLRATPDLCPECGYIPAGKAA